ncbi:RNA polymerase sigma factor region1.1 domain-containing protein, partial [Patescibacteria group bacterium]|nr:RNA polymerase sigma factor region1.1 domain-containing protein [Patescibacteria group bacterium]
MAKIKKESKKKPERVQKLLQKGKEQGFITQDEILNAFPEAENH